MQHHGRLPPPQCLCVTCTPGPGAPSSQPVSWSSPPEQHMILHDYCYCLWPSSRRLRLDVQEVRRPRPRRRSPSWTDKRGTLSLICALERTNSLFSCSCRRARHHGMRSRTSCMRGGGERRRVTSNLEPATLSSQSECKHSRVSIRETSPARLIFRSVYP